MMRKLDSILLIDDDEIGVYVAQIILDECDAAFHVEIAKNGKEAISYIENCEGAYPSLMFLDTNMPIMGGNEFMNWYIHSEYNHKIKIVLCSGCIRQEEMDMMTSNPDIISCLEKPITKDKLHNILNEYF